MNLPQVSVKRPVTTVMFFLAIMLFGLVSLTMLNLDILPEVELPALTVVTVYPGASAQEVEEQVTKVLERQLASVPDLKKITSKSKENVSFISLQFNFGAVLNDAANDARDKLELVKSLMPEGSETPKVIRITSDMMPVLMYGISAAESENALDKIIDDKISTRLKKLKGVGAVIVIGQQEREIKVDVDPFKLKAYHLSLGQIVQILKLENITIPGGNVKFGEHDLAVRVPGEFENVSEIGEIVLTSFNGNLIRLKDVASVEDGFKEKDEVMRSGQRGAVGLLISKQSGSNTLEVTDAIRAEMEKVQKTLPADVGIEELNNAAELVTGSIHNMGSTIGWAFLFVILVVFFFLREWRSSLIISLTIPVSMISAFIIMYVAGYTINIFSLMALAITIGMVVDNAIVVLEIITRHIEDGESPKLAAVNGSSEVGLAIAASTLTTIAVFLPMVFIGGLVGILFKQLALLASGTMIMSLIAALSLTPMLSSQMLKAKSETRKKHGKFFEWSERIFVRTENSYKRQLHWAVNHRGFVMLAALALFVISLGVAKIVGSDYIPDFDAGDVQAVIELEVGTSVQRTAEITKQVESIFKEEIPNEAIRSLYSVTGQTETGLLSMVGFKEGKNSATIAAKLIMSDYRDFRAQESADKIRERVAMIPEIVNFHVSGGSQLSTVMKGNVKPVELKIMGNDFTHLNEAAREIEKTLKSQGHFVNVENTVDAGKVELQIKLKRDKMQQLGLNTAMIAMTVRQAIYGADASDFKEGGDGYTIKVRYDSKHRNDPNMLKNIMLTTLTGTHVPLSAVADIVEGRGPLEIARESQQRIVYVKADLKGVSLGDGVEEAEALLAEMEFPPDVSVELGGQFEDQQESFSSLYLLFVVGILLIYMIMASQFESLRHPFIIMFAVPLSIIGVIWAFVLTGTTLSTVTFIGVIMLLGVVVNNGIVLVDYINLLRGRGMGLMEAVTESGRLRLRPVLMTPATTILAMVPMATSTGLGSEMWSPLGITVIGGLLFSTLITLILVPVIYVSMHRKDL